VALAFVPHTPRYTGCSKAATPGRHLPLPTPREEKKEKIEDGEDD